MTLAGHFFCGFNGLLLQTEVRNVINKKNMNEPPVWLLISPSAQGKQSKQQWGSPGRLACLLPGEHGELQRDAGT